ncbi:unnamed protein product [Euphydryas editha]|uniref:RNA-directed DNA polymerase from mobile element jockey n=1 Tax=Euphydryas editha TaxID=104508 RepID=A0AAU9UE45_EUPED|nr:unnamed protein product [Euphydryas editha]
MSFLWMVLSNSLGSDHFPIVINFYSAPSKSAPLPPLLKYRTQKADWRKFSSSLDSKTATLPPVSDNNFLLCYDLFISCLCSAADESIPLKNSSLDKIPSPPWWDSECTDSVRKRKAAEDSYLSDLSMLNYLNLKRTIAKSKRLLSKKKSSGWRNFCESLSPRAPASLVWRKIKSFRQVLQDDRNVSSNDSSYWLPNFVNNLAPPYVPPENNFLCPPSYMTLERFNDSFSLNELFSALDGLKDSSPGIDGIPYSFIMKSSTSVKLYLLDIFNLIYSSGIVPDSWKTHIIIPILKPNKDPRNPTSYRPIALSSVMAKIMEHLIKNRLEWIIESRGLLSKFQFGFRKGMGSLDSLSILTTDVWRAFSSGKHVIGAFLDISSAYDNVELHILRQKMFNLNLPTRIINIVFNLYSARYITVRVQGSLLPKRIVWKGLPQGSVLSPLLYNLYTYDLDKSVLCFCNILQYADDIALYSCSLSFSEANSKLNSALYYLNNWLTDHGLTLSVSKCSGIVFTRKRSVPDSISLHINNQPITIQNHVKFLGVILDSKMSGVQHLNYISNKCEKNINILRSLSGVRWGSHPYSQKLLYNAIIRSHFDYASFVLEPCNKVALSYWTRLQAKCLRIIAGAMKMSPTNALQVELVDPPLHLRRQFLCDRFLINAVQISSHPLIDKLHDLNQLINNSNFWIYKDKPPLTKSFLKININDIYQFDKNPLFTYSYDSLIYYPRIILNLGVTKKTPGAALEFSRIIDSDWSEWLHFFTDSSKINPELNVGSAVWIPKYNIILNYKLPPHSSTFSGECIAILEAVLYIESHGLNKSVIFTDSRSCLQDLLKSPFHAKNNLPIILRIKEILYKCQQSNIEVALAWIPSHSDIAGNEMADICAKDSIRLGCDKYNKCFSRDFRSLAKQCLDKSWDRLWQSSRLVTGKYYGNIQPSIPIRPWFFKYSDLGKIATSIIIRIRLGFSCTPVFLAKLRIRDSSLCECGLEEGSLNHLFFNCPKLTVSLYDMLPKNIPRPVNVCFLLTLVPTSFCVVLAKFIKINDIKL